MSLFASSGFHSVVCALTFGLRQIFGPARNARGPRLLSLRR